MPVNWTISHVDREVHAIASAELGADEIQNYLGSVIAEEAMPYSKLFDISQVTSVADADRLTEVADTVRLYDKMKLGPIGALAIVVGDNPQQAHFAQVFVRVATAKRPVQIFDDIKKARAWLKHSSSAGRAP